MLIGTMQWKSTRGSGSFRCPACEAQQPYRLRATRTFLTIYFIPVVPVGRATEFVLCENCRGTFAIDVLAAQGKAGFTSPPIPFDEDLLMAIAAVMLDDGLIDDLEVDAAQTVFLRITGQSVSRDDLGGYCGDVQQMRLTAKNHIRQAVQRWSHVQRIQILQAMFAVSASTGEISPNRMKTLESCMLLMDLSPEEYQQAIEEAAAWE